MAGRLPDTMTAIAIKEPGEPDVLVPVSLPTPQPKADEVLIRVTAAGVNRPDVMQRRGFYPPPPGAPDTPGLEVAGVVAATSRTGGRFKIGDRVLALVPGGGYAQFCIADERCTLPAPASLSDIECAGIPETFFTVWTNVFELGSLKSGETLLVHGGTSGIGTAAIPLARALGARVLTTAGSDEKCDATLKLGAARAVNYKTGDFAAEFANETIHVVLDMVGGTYVARNLALLTTGGRHVSIAVQGGARAEINIVQIMQKRLIMTGSTLRPRTPVEKGHIAAAVEKHVWPLLESGAVKPVIDSVLPLAQAAAAHRRMESSGHVGKIVLTVD